VCNNLNFKGAA